MLLYKIAEFRFIEFYLESHSDFARDYGKYEKPDNIHQSPKLFKKVKWDPKLPSMNNKFHIKL